MKFYLTFIALIFAIAIKLHAENDYSVSNIPENLKKNARSVIRIDEQILELHDAGKAVYKNKFAITILNKNGINDAIFEEYYDKYSRISMIKGRVYDKNGKLIKRISKTDIQDFSAVSNGSIFDDNRVKVIDPEIQNFPFTVEYEYTNILKSTLKIPSWSPIIDYEVSSESSKIEIIVPNSNELRFLEKNLDFKVKTNHTNEYNTYIWETKNIAALKPEPFSKTFYEIIPIVHFSLNSFEVGTTVGNLSSWKEFGKWLYTLNKERDTLPNESIIKIKELTKDIVSDKEKAKILYEYMQKNTRYVSVQVGIGGFQPFEAEVVDRLGYGDCKALSNYMKTILRYAGIESYYTLVNAGKNANSIISDFPSNQFNHVILCLPNKGDTIWLECTSQTNPFDYLGSFTDNRHVLLVKEEGGELVKTPKFLKEENGIDTKAKVFIKNDAICNAEINRTYKGAYYRIGKSFILSDKKDQSKMIYNTIDIPQFTVQSFNFTEKREETPTIIEDTYINLDNYTTSLGSNLLFDLNLMNKIKNTPKYLNNRKSDIYIKRPVLKTDTITYVLPQEYQVSTLPDHSSIDSKFGKYSSKTSIINNNIVYIRQFELYDGVYPKTDYNELIKFYKSIVKQDQQRLVIKGS